MTIHYRTYYYLSSEKKLARQLAEKYPNSISLEESKRRLHYRTCGDEITNMIILEELDSLELSGRLRYMYPHSSKQITPTPKGDYALFFPL